MFEGCDFQAFKENSEESSKGGKALQIFLQGKTLISVCKQPSWKMKDEVGPDQPRISRYDVGLYLK